jgi:type I restriction enzyme S subunit
MKSNWRLVEIGDICELINGRAFKPSEWVDNGLPIVRIQNLNDESKPFNYYDGAIDEKHLVKDGDLLFSWSGTPGTSFGAFFWNRGKAVLNQHIFNVKVNESKVYDAFFQIAINSKLQHIIGQSHGGVGLKHITKGKFEAVQIHLPPLDDQIRIATVLTRAEKLIAKRKESIKALDELLKSTFLEMFGDIKAKKSIHPWEKPRPYLIAQSGKSSKNVLSASKTDIPIYGGNGINGWATESLFHEPVVIAGRVGQQCGVIHVSKGSCWVTDNAIVLKIRDTSKLHPIYLANALAYSPILEKVKQLDLPFINQSMLLDILIPMPAIKIQIQFAAIVKKVESIKSKYTQSLTELENLYGSLSQRAFKGELDLRLI